MSLEHIGIYNCVEKYTIGHNQSIFLIDPLVSEMSCIGNESPDQCQWSSMLRVLSPNLQGPSST